MEVPCPVPLTKPWSPVGYQVVELPANNEPDGTQPPQVTLAEPVAKTPAKNAIPRSPVGYRVVTVADDVVPVPKREPRFVRDTGLLDDDDDIRLWRRERPRKNPWAIWIPIGTVAAVLSVPVMAVALILSHAQARHERQVIAAVVPEAIVPEAIRANAPADKKAEEPLPAKIEAAVPAAAPPEANDAAGDPFDVANQAKQAQPPRQDREGFETAVDFVRNPQEAGRLAKEENKLAFILHLSGNFEDPGFT